MEHFNSLGSRILVGYFSNFAGWISCTMAPAKKRETTTGPKNADIAKGAMKQRRAVNNALQRATRLLTKSVNDSNLSGPSVSHSGRGHSARGPSSQRHVKVGVQPKTWGTTQKTVSTHSHRTNSSQSVNRDSSDSDSEDLPEQCGTSP